MTRKELEMWRQQATQLHGDVAQFFKPKENLVIADFIQTVTSRPPSPPRRSDPGRRIKP